MPRFLLASVAIATAARACAASGQNASAASDGASREATLLRKGRGGDEAPVAASAAAPHGLPAVEAAAAAETPEAAAEAALAKLPAVEAAAAQALGAPLAPRAEQDADAAAATAEAPAPVPAPQEAAEQAAAQDVGDVVGAAPLGPTAAAPRDSATALAASKEPVSQLRGAVAAEAASGSVSVGTFFWNVHWQCSVGARGSSPACKDRAAQRFQELAQGASIVASVELSNGMSEALQLIPGWAQVSGPCARGYGGDSVALAFAPGWSIQGSSGGCLRHDWDTRAFAVALVRPPAPVQGCPSLCVVALHAPHSRITVGGDVVRAVCGEAAQRCSVAMGDWNVPAGGVQRRWEELVGGAPALVGPNERTCCFPEWQHYGLFDHVASNVAGARLESYTVHPYQILEEHPWEQHRPIFARLSLPSAR